MIEIILGVVLLVLTIIAAAMLLRKPKPQQQWNSEFQNPQTTTQQISASSRGASPEEIQAAVKKVVEAKQYERKKFIEEKTKEMIDNGKRKLAGI